MPIIHDVEQGSAEWFRLRLGIPTASCFDQIITPAKGELSASWRKYAYRLVAERLLNMPTETLNGIEHIERGKELEPSAVRQYEFVEGVDTAAVGFITTNDGRIGASPDRIIVGRPVALEIKCPAAHTHLGYLLDGRGNEYKPQLQGQLWVGEFEYGDFYSYHPLMPAARARIVRDDAYIEKLAAALDEFCDKLDEMTDRARALGIFQRQELAPHPVDVAMEQFNPLGAG